jgi:hypothetical protein
MPTAAHRQRKLSAPREVERGAHIRHVSATRDQERMAVDIGAVERAGVVVAILADLNELAAHARSQVLYLCGVIRMMRLLLVWHSSYSSLSAADWLASAQRRRRGDRALA